MLLAAEGSPSPEFLPNFFVVGAAKAGTSSVHYYLAQHPEICMPTQKEPRFFSFVNAPPQYTSPDALRNVVSNFGDYVRLFKNPTPEQKLGDASPSYLYLYEPTIANIRAIYGSERFKELRIIILLRQPADRAWSQYWTFKRVMNEPLEFADAIKPETISARLDAGWNVFYDYIGFGMYSAQVRAYQEAFGAENVAVFLFEDLATNAEAVCRKIFEFIGVNPSFQLRDRAIYNVSGRPKSDLAVRALVAKSPLKSVFKFFVPRHWRDQIRHFLARILLKKASQPPASRAALTEVFRDDIRELERLTQRDLSHWLKP